MDFVGAGKEVSFVGFFPIIGQNHWDQNDCSLAKVQNSGLAREGRHRILGVIVNCVVRDGP